MVDDNRGWHEDSERHREVSRERRESKTNWWPLLFLPVAFVIGWAGGDASDSNDNRQASLNQTQPGVGGGPDVTITPGTNNATFTVPTSTVNQTDDSATENESAEIEVEVSPGVNNGQ